MARLFWHGVCRHESVGAVATCGYDTCVCVCVCVRVHGDGTILLPGFLRSLHACAAVVVPMLLIFLLFFFRVCNVCGVMCAGWLRCMQVNQPLAEYNLPWREKVLVQGPDVIFEVC